MTTPPCHHRAAAGLVCAIVAGCLSVACTRTRQVAFYEEPYPLATAMTVSAGGVTVGTLSREHPRFDLTVTRGMPSRDGNPDLRFETDTPCGRRAIDGSVSLTNKNVFSFGGNIYDTLRFWYDNRGGGPARLSIGSLEVPLPAGQSGDFRVLFTGCTGSLPIKVDGASAGEIRLDERARERGFVIDPSGRRCYSAQYGVYTRSGSSRGSPAESFSGKQFYEWAPITDFLKEPAKTIAVPSIVGAIDVSSWREVECTK